MGSKSSFTTEWVVNGGNIAGKADDQLSSLFMPGNPNDPKNFETLLPLKYTMPSPPSMSNDERDSGNRNKIRKHAEQESSQSTGRRSHSKSKSRSSIHQSSRQRSRRKQKGLGRAGKPGITVDTSFSLHKGAPPREVLPKGQGSGISLNDENPTSGKTSLWSKAKSLRRSARGSRNLQDHEATSGRNFRSDAPITSARTAGTEDPYRSAASERSAQTLTPSRLKSLDISPSDRAILVGMAVPMSESDFSGNDREQTRPDSEEYENGPDTPTIIITPAMHTQQWLRDQKGQDHRPRPPSSVYSRATAFYSPSAPVYEDVPPVPALPSKADRTTSSEHDAKDSGYGSGSAHSEPRVDSGAHRDETRDSTMTTFEEDEEAPHKDRTTSYCTIFEEDEPDMKPSRGVQDLTIDTSIPTPRRSKGWWNVITTPFELSRSNSRATRTGAYSPESPPDVPAIPTAAALAGPDATSPNIHRHSTNMSHEPFQSAFSASTITTMTTPWSAEPNEKEFSSRFSVAIPPLKLASIPEKSQVNLHDEKVVEAGKIETKELPPTAGDHTPVEPPKPTDRITLFPVGITSVSSPADARVAPAESPKSQPREDVTAGTESAVRSTENETTSRVAAHVWPNTSTTNQVSTTHTHERLIERSVDRVFERPPERSHEATPPPPVPPAYARHTPPPSDRNPTTFDAPPRRSYSSSSKSQKSKKEPSLPAKLFGRKHRKRHEKKKEKRRKRRLGIFCCCCLSFLALLILALALALTLSRKHGKNTAVQSQWLNLTQYPPMPTGIATIAQPDAVTEISGCVQPATLWSCALPKEQQASIAPNQPDQPNFRVMITFQNGTMANLTNSKRHDISLVNNPVSAGAFIRSHLNRIRASSSSTQSSPSPAPPSLQDQIFLGNTTDGNQSPFQGEATPFYISFISPTQAVSSNKVKRDSTSSNGTFSNITSIIPPPLTNSDGTAAAANLLPFPSSQPLRLYNRGQPDEHYGFYTYFDRSIFLKDINGSSNSFGGNPSDTNGGATFDGATQRCTWAQTRFLVQIWTKSQASKPLLSSSNSTASKSSSSSSSDSAADDFVRPGSFPYPVTVTLDRHGGALAEKMIYCYGMDTSGRIIPSDKKFSLEDRSFGGVLVNPASGPFDNIKVNTTDGGPGGIDGGTGGCQCQWQNWLKT